MRVVGAPGTRVRVGQDRGPCQTLFGFSSNLASEGKGPHASGAILFCNCPLFDLVDGYRPSCLLDLWIISDYEIESTGGSPDRRSGTAHSRMVRFLPRQKGTARFDQTKECQESAVSALCSLRFRRPVGPGAPFLSRQNQQGEWDPAEQNPDRIWSGLGTPWLSSI